MKLKTLHLKNIKSYEDETITFYDGVNFISGINGAGKSTIIDSIGFALFDSKPGVLGEFVRYGAKTGVITLEFEAADERLYRVVRKVGSVSSWVIYDGESGQEIDLHGAADIKPWLKSCLGLEQEQDLAQLFNDVVGVSQGTFTAPFLDRPADRRQKFNRMLQVEAYNEAFLKSREVNSYLQSIVNAEENKRERLLGQTEGYEQSKEEADRVKSEVKSLETQVATIKTKLNKKLKERDFLRKTKEAIQTNQQKISVLQVEIKALKEQREECLKDLEQASQAAKIAVDNKSGYDKYLSLQKALAELEEKGKKRAELEKSHNKLLTQLKALKAEFETLQNTWSEQRTKNQELLKDCSQKLQALKGKVEKEKEAYLKLEARVEEVQQIWEKIKSPYGSSPLENLSNRFQNGLEKWGELKEEISASEKIVQEVENLKEKAEEVNKLQEKLQQARLELAALWEKLRSLRESKEQVKDGLCPHLNEPCLNIQGNLQDYFAKQEKETSLQVAEKEKQVSHLEKVYQEGEKVFQQLQATEVERKRLKNSLLKEETYRQTFRKLWQDSFQLELIVQAQNLLKDCTKLLQHWQQIREDTSLSLPDEISHTYEQLAAVWQKFSGESVLGESFGLREVENLLGLLKGLIKCEEAFYLAVTEFADLVKEDAVTVKNNSFNQLSGLQLELNNMEKQFTELDKVERELEEKAESLKVKKLTIKKLEEDALTQEQQLSKFELLDEDLERTKKELANQEESYHLYIKYQEEAKKLADLQNKLVKIEGLKAEKIEEEKTIKADLAELSHDFSPEKLADLEIEVEREQQEFSKVEANLNSRREKLQELLDSLAKMEEALKQIELIEKKLRKYKRVKDMLDFIRNIFNHAGEKVATVYREYLAQEASRIYREVSKENISLEWQKDYEVVLVDQVGGKKRERCFRQLSGGEQMTAALAVRLALLKQLAGIKVGFFDEPTTNLDSERRNHLASVIPQVTKDFDQLFIISHDDSFDAMTDNVIELSKDTGDGTKQKRLA